MSDFRHRIDELANALGSDGHQQLADTLTLAQRLITREYHSGNQHVVNSWETADCMRLAQLRDALAKP